MGQNTNLNIRLTLEMLGRIDARIEELQAANPGASFTRSDVIRMAIEAQIPASYVEAKKLPRKASR